MTLMCNLCTGRDENKCDLLSLISILQKEGRRKCFIPLIHLRRRFGWRWPGCCATGCRRFCLLVCCFRSLVVMSSMRGVLHIHLCYGRVNTHLSQPKKKSLTLYLLRAACFYISSSHYAHIPDTHAYTHMCVCVCMCTSSIYCFYHQSSCCHMETYAGHASSLTQLSVWQWRQRATMSSLTISGNIARRLRSMKALGSMLVPTP